MKKLDRDSFTSQRCLHNNVERFTREWAPGDPRRRAEFNADLILLVQAVHHDAMIPVERLLSNALRCIPLSPLFLKDKEPPSDG